MNLVSGGQIMTIRMAHAHHMLITCIGVVHAYWGVVHALVSSV